MGGVRRPLRSRRRSLGAVVEATSPAASVAAMSRKSGSRSSSKKSKKSGGGSNVFDMFTQRQVAEFKEGFQLMDRDKDGVIGKSDLRATFDEIGRIATDQELDDIVAKAFIAFADDNGLMDCDNFRHALMTWGDKFTNQEADDALDQMDIDDAGKIEVQSVIQMLTAGGGAEETAEEETA